MNHEAGGLRRTNDKSPRQSHTACEHNREAARLHVGYLLDCPRDVLMPWLETVGSSDLQRVQRRIYGDQDLRERAIDLRRLVLRFVDDIADACEARGLDAA